MKKHNLKMFSALHEDEVTFVFVLYTEMRQTDILRYYTTNECTSH